MGFCSQKLHWNGQNNWSSIIFSDETKIMLGRNEKVYAWRKPDERFRPDCLGQLDDFETTCRASVMFWGCIAYYGAGTLVAIDGNMNTDKYISVLDDNLWPVVVRHFSDRPWIFQEDNAPCHVALRANKWKEENGIRILLWPPQSPYLNIIENVWKVLKIQVHKRLREIKNADDLRRVVLDIWTGYVCTTYEVYMTVYLGGSGVF
jgi:hypothetical protein